MAELPTGNVGGLTEANLQVHLRRAPVALQLLDETDSTNLDAKRWAAAGAPHGALVVARQQTAGRGRLGRAFSSPPGGIYMSAILRCTPAVAQKPGLVTSAAAVAVCRAVARLCHMELQIKWVNDLYRAGKKCCGILAEGVILPGAEQYLVVGIGLNYQTPASAFSDAAAQVATALYPDGDAPVPESQLLAAIYDELLDITDALPDTAFLQEYRRRNLVLGQTVTVLDAPPYTAKALDVDDEARLILELPDGTQQVLSWGEISVRVDNR